MSDENRILSYVFSYEFTKEEIASVSGGGNCHTTSEVTWSERGGADAKADVNCNL